MATCYYDSYGRRRCRNSAFSSWGRWIVLGVILLFAVLFLLCVCAMTRRRRAKGGKPIYGTGWMPGTKPAQAQQGYGQENQQYGGQQQQYQAPQGQGGYAPEQPKPTYNQGGAANSYYNQGGQQGGYEMPYQPPAGPPPGQYK